MNGPLLGGFVAGENPDMARFFAQMLLGRAFLVSCVIIIRDERTHGCVRSRRDGPAKKAPSSR
jgi:hypothetical protein